MEYLTCAVTHARTHLPGVAEAERIYAALPAAYQRLTAAAAAAAATPPADLPAAAARALAVDFSKAHVTADSLAAFAATCVSILAGAALLCLVVNFRSVLYKAKLYGQGMLHLLFSTDKKWKGHAGAAGRPEKGAYHPYREIIFLRHGESTWNDTFNRSKNPIYFVPRLFKAWAYEAWLFLSGRYDSWFYDSPLSDHGTGQAQALADFLATAAPFRDYDAAQAKYITVLKGGGTPAVHVVSNLRRAISTNAIGLNARLQATGEQMVILPALQEISRNIDTLSITPPHSTPVASWIDARHPHLDLDTLFATSIDASNHTGNKRVRCSGVDRLVAFCDWAFAQDAFNVIVGGHSLWFKAFFNEFLPLDSSFVGKTSKLHNAGAVGFTLLRLADDAGNPVYLIDEDSITELFRGFDVKSKKK